MPVLLVLTVACFVLPNVFARHAVELMARDLNRTARDRAELERLFRDPNKSPGVRLAYRWGLAGGLVKLARWPMLILLILALV